MNTTLLNNPTKFGAKIFRLYQVITFYVLGHFFSRTLYRVFFLSDAEMNNIMYAEHSFAYIMLFISV